MYALPFPMCPYLTKEELLTYECSDRILLSKSIASSHLFETKTILYIYNIYNEFVIGCVYKIYEGGEDDCVYLPSWMFWKHDFTGSLHLSQSIKKGWTAFQIRSAKKTFQSRKDFLPQLQKSLNTYSTLSQNTRIPLNVDGSIEYVQIDSAFPTNVKTCALSLCGSVDIQIFPSLDSVPQTTDMPMFLYSSPPGTERYPCAFLGKAHVVGGAWIPSGTPTEQAAAAARRRLRKR